jgi:glycosyltransferase involved in cell wall biosynthesis
MACGTPVVTSNVSCLPEIAGDAALLVDPTDVNCVAKAMYRLHDDEPLRQQLIQRGLARAKQFTWERCAHQTLTAYHQMAAIGGDSHPTPKR